MYIDIEWALERGLAQKTKVRLNGVLQKEVIRAKSGKNGFVESYSTPFRVLLNGDVAKNKTRGYVKISFNLTGEQND